MKSPRHLGNYPDRDLDCQFYLEDEFVRLTDLGESAGWVRVEVLNALFELARNHLISSQALNEDDQRIMERMREIEHPETYGRKP
ncbi:hypothetical protein G3A39_42460 [Paraburkholderia aspalathi]|nr:hypothetical protein [Paraburkholderia aspalathi]